MKPVIMYVDDEAHNLTVLEAALPEDWEIHTFDSPLAALDKLPSLKPWVVLSDQRMPGMVGVNFLEIVKKVSPTSIRAIVTGFSDEDLVVDSVRKAQIFDYIRKPWDVDELEHRVQKMIDAFQMSEELRLKTDLLEKKNSELLVLTKNLEEAKEYEFKLRKELEAWAPPFILDAIFNNDLKFPIYKDLAVITFDLVGSSKLHGKKINNRSVRSIIINAFSEILLKHNGWRESHSGDSAFGHFGLLKVIDRPTDSAFAAATEFRVFLRNFTTTHGIEVECGIGLHVAKNCLIDIHTIKVTSDEKVILQKSFDTTSNDVDLVHRMEKFTHSLPGSNIIMSDAFFNSLQTKPFGLVDIGKHNFKGQENSIQLYLKHSDQVQKEDIDKLKVA